MRNRKPSSRRSQWLLVGLVLVSVVLFFLPVTWRASIRGLVQLVVPFQHAASVVVDARAEPPAGEGASNGVSTVGVPASSIETWEHRTAALSLRVQDLEEEVRLLTATRMWEVGGRRMGSTGRLIPARAVSEDVLPWRDSLLLNAGRLQGVRTGAVVVADQFSIDSGEAIGLREGMAVLLGETLVGWIEELHAQAARVKCVSDLSVEMKVKVGRVTEAGFQSVEGFFWLAGRGRGRMEIREVDQRLVQDGALTIGDLVISDPTSPFLAFPMVVGRVSEIAPNRENPLFSVVTVRMALDDRAPHRVYVYDPREDDDR